MEHFAHIECLDKERLYYGTSKVVGKYKVSIAGLNSAWSCCQDNENGRLWMAARWQAENAQQKTCWCQGADLRILLMHHPPSWLTEPDRTEFWHFIMQKEFDVALHGHEHTSWVTALASGTRHGFGRRDL
jgi:hypothetical protein